MPLDGFIVTLPRLPANWQTALFAKCRHYLIGISAHFSFLMDMRKIQPASRVLKQQHVQAALAATSLGQLRDGTSTQGVEAGTWKLLDHLMENTGTEEEKGDSRGMTNSGVNAGSQNNVTLLWQLNSLEFLKYFTAKATVLIGRTGLPQSRRQLIYMYWSVKSFPMHYIQKYQTFEWGTWSRAHKVGHLLKQLRDGNSYIKVAVYSFIIVAYISRNRPVSLFHIYLPGLSEQW